MKSFSDLLIKFKNFTSPDKEVREDISKIIFNITGIEVSVSNILIKNRTVFVKETPSVKALIFIKKKLLLKEFLTIIGQKAPEDIR